MKNKQNPFLAVLPPLYEFDDFVLKTRSYPKFPRTTSNIQMNVLLNDLYDYFEPHETTYDFYVVVASMLYGGYKRRSPEDIYSFISKSVELTAENIYNQIRLKTLTLNSCGGATLIGYPGMGKTLNCLRIQSLFQPLYRHQELGITQIPILKIDCPERGTILQLCRNFFSKLDSIAGTTYAQQYRNTSEPELMRQMINKAVIHFIGLLIFDETQNLKVVTEREGDMTMKFIRFLSNEFKVPVIFVGTKQAEEILKKNLQSASRQQASGALKWDRLKLDTKEQEDNWDLIIEGLWEQQVFKKKALTKGIIGCYYKHSKGIYRLLITVHMAAQRVAIRNEWYYINEEVLNIAAEEEMFLTTKMILALENKESKLLDLWDDMHESKSPIKENVQIKQNQDDDDLLKLAKVVHPKIGTSVLVSLVKQVNSEFKKSSLEDKAAILSEKIEQLPSVEVCEKKEKRKESSELLTITENATTSLEAYSVLKDAGIIKNLNQYIDM